MNISILGATGFIGRPLCRALLDANHDVAALVRDPNRAAGKLPGKVRIVPWQIGGSKDFQDALKLFSQTDAVINLAGAPIGGHRWTPQVKEEIRRSRIDTTRALVDVMRAAPKPNRVLLNASAVGYYGDRGDETVTEQTSQGGDFLGKLCVEWESEALKAEKQDARVVLLRTGIVLGEGGALEKMLTPFKLFVGGPLGSGRQWVPWIHREDAVRMIVWALENPDVRGPLNVTAPNPVTMREFARTLGKVMHRPSSLPVPGFALKLLLGEFADALLGGQKAIPESAQRLGFLWKFWTLELALRDLLGRRDA